MKLKEGDIVQIMGTATRAKYMKYNNPKWNSSMDQYVNNIVTISGTPYRNAIVKENPYVWMIEDLKLVSLQEKLNWKYKHEI
jgi:hypothetical protein